MPQPNLPTAARDPHHAFTAPWACYSRLDSSPRRTVATHTGPVVVSLTWPAVATHARPIVNIRGPLFPSAGGLIARAYIQRCNRYPVINFLSWNSPQGGQFGGLGIIIPAWVMKLLNTVPYQDGIQEHVTLAQYWRDPYNLVECVDAWPAVMALAAGSEPGCHLVPAGSSHDVPALIFRRTLVAAPILRRPSYDVHLQVLGKVTVSRRPEQ